MIKFRDYLGEEVFLCPKTKYIGSLKDFHGFDTGIKAVLNIIILTTDCEKLKDILDCVEYLQKIISNSKPLDNFMKTSRLEHIESFKKLRLQIINKIKINC